MLLPTMTYKEMYDNFSKDLKKVKIREDYFSSKRNKRIQKKERKFLVWMWIHGKRREIKEWIRNINI